MYDQGCRNLSTGYDDVFLFVLLVLFVFEFSFLLESMLGFLFIFLLAFILFTAVTHKILLSLVRSVQVPDIVDVKSVASLNLPLAYN